MTMIRIIIDGYLRTSTIYFPDTEEKKNHYEVRDLDSQKVITEGYDTETSRVRY